MSIFKEPSFRLFVPLFLVRGHANDRKEGFFMSAPKRVSPSKKMRFEVLKRDSFTCQYCGAKAPETILVIDHIHPVAKGGKTTMLNLVTSCVPCNSGKSDRKLDDAAVIDASRKQAEEMQAKQEQLKMLLEWRAGLCSIEEKGIQAVSERFAHLTQRGFTPVGVQQLRSLIKKFGLNECLEVLEIAVSRYDPQDVLAKMGGIAARRIIEREDPGRARILHLINIFRKRWTRCSWHDAREIEDALRGLLARGHAADDVFEYFRPANRMSTFREMLQAAINPAPQPQ